jgi:hypothetical protein
MKLIKLLGNDTIRHDTSTTAWRSQMKKLGMMSPLEGTTPSSIDVTRLDEIGHGCFMRNLTGLSGKVSKSTAH